MSQPPNNDIARQYLGQQIQNATQVQQVIMLYDGAIRFLLKAKQAIEEKDVLARHNHNRRAISILAYLMDILDLDKGGDAAQSLMRIYGALMHQMLQIDFKNDPVVVDEVIAHFQTLRKNWEELARQEAQQKQQSGATPASGDATAGKRTAIA
jgi:flagellar protein FliS